MDSFLTVYLRSTYLFVAGFFLCVYFWCFFKLLHWDDYDIGDRFLFCSCGLAISFFLQIISSIYSRMV